MLAVVAQLYLVDGRQDAFAPVVILLAVAVEAVGVLAQGIGAHARGGLLVVVAVLAHQVLGAQHAPQRGEQLGRLLAVHFQDVVERLAVELPHIAQPPRALPAQAQPVGVELPVGLLHQGVGALLAAFQRPQLHPVQVLLQVIRLGVLAQGDMAAHLALQQGDLVRAVQAAVDPGQVHPALERAHRLEVALLLLQGQAQAEHLLGQVRAVGALAGLDRADGILQGLLRGALGVTLPGVVAVLARQHLELVLGLGRQQAAQYGAAKQGLKREPGHRGFRCYSARWAGSIQNSAQGQQYIHSRRRQTEYRAGA